ncbi:hypothetical protein HDU86_003128 [Geranomyces michiganensis]|nr:hypothetical protein HDU86_003128 [Geranomyces michiganensis]
MLATNASGKLRLGYACLNTVLRAQDPSIFCSRTCRLATVRELGIEHAHKLALQNALDIIPMIHWNEAHGIRFMRLSSEMLPFASHAEVGYRVADVPGLPQAFKEVGDVARALQHRLTMHPGQFCQLASPREVVFDAAIRDLEFHADILDMIGLGPDSVMIIHMVGGGVYNDKEATLARFTERWPRVPPRIQSRIVLENDDVSYSVHDLLPISETLQIPLVLDWHHANIIPSPEPTESYLSRINAVWNQRGIRPKQHYSESRPNAVTPTERRAHSKRVERLPPCVDPGTDVMIEAKDKEQAVLHLYRVYNLEPVADGYPVSPARQDELAKLAKRQPKKPKKEKAEPVDGEEGDGGGEQKPVKRVRAKRVIKKVVKTEVNEGEEEEEEEALPKPKRRRAVKQESSSVASINDEEAPAPPPPPAKRARTARKSKAIIETEVVKEVLVAVKPKKTRGRAIKAEPSADSGSDDAPLLPSTIEGAKVGVSKPKRGRPSKAMLSADASSGSNGISLSQTGIEAAEITPPKRKRGRPPKAKAPAADR